MRMVLLMWALLGSQAEPKPEWIWTSKAAADGESAYFRRAFETGAVASATLSASCDNRLTVFVNGKQAAASDEWTQPVRVDAKPLLKEGRNVLAVHGKNDGGVAALVVRLEIRTADGKRETIVSDASWQASTKAAQGWETPGFDASGWGKAVSLGAHGRDPWGNVLGGAAAQAAGGGGSATAAEKIAVKAGFKVELLHSVPKATQGSWVSMCADPKGRLIVSDQGKLGLFRLTVKGAEVDVEKIDVPVSGAQGLLCAFDSLYANVDGKGLHRITDTNGDDRYDKAELIVPLKGGGEHGPHAVVVTEDGKGLYLVAGNHTDPPDGLTGSRISANWQEDLILPRQWDAKGHARGRLAPGGWVCRISPDGREREMFSIGYRNEYDVAVNRHGEMFTFDSDMEWDLGMPWYRPTRVCHVVSGSEFGWRSGTGKWPSHYADSLPATVDIGPASPTGTLFGTGAKFPAKYQDALYILDWTYGTIWAVHLKPQGASYEAEVEEFVAGTPLPVTDAAVGADRALYFAIGGRGTQSGLYRVTYIGSEPTAPAQGGDAGSAARAVRRSLEAFHGRRDPKALETAWPHLGSPDRFLRYAARLAVESQPVETWQGRALEEKDPHARITALVALARQGPRTALDAALGSLHALDFGRLTEVQRLEALRAYQLALIRMGPPGPDARKKAIERLDALYPHGQDDIDRELAQLLVYLEAPKAVEKTLRLMSQAGPTPPPRWVTVLDRNRGYGGTVEKMFQNMPPLSKLHFAFVLRNAREGWTLERRKAYFEFLNEALTKFSGGASFQGFVQNIKKDAVANCSDADRRGLGPLVADIPRKVIRAEGLPAPKGPGKAWTVGDVVPLVEAGLAGRNFDNGKRTFQAARCIVCHRFDGEGGDTGPDLTGVAGRFGPRDLLEALIEPSKVVSDQYQAMILRTKDGDVITGRILEEKDGKLLVATDLLKADQLREVPKASVAEMKPSTLSTMPDGLLSPLNQDEVLDLIAFLYSAGNRKHPAFR